MTKRQFKNMVRHMVQESVRVRERRIDTLLKSGAIDLKTADLKTCKAATRAFLLEEADQYMLYSHEPARKRAFNGEVANMRTMM